MSNTLTSNDPTSLREHPFIIPLPHMGVGSLPRLAIVRLEALNIDMTYQRAVSQKKVDLIARTFDPVAAGYLVVSLRPDNTLWLVDGQHRVRAMQMRRTLFPSEAPIEYWYAALCADITTQQEALTFAHANTARAIPSRITVIRALLAAGDPRAVAINQIVEDEGFHLATSATYRGPWNVIRAVGALERIYGVYYDNQRPEMLRGVLRILRQAWERQEHVTTSFVILGVFFFHFRYAGDYDEARLLNVLQRRGLPAFMTAARNPGWTLGQSYGMNMARAILAEYNRGLRTPLEDRFSVPLTLPEFTSTGRDLEELRP